MKKMLLGLLCLSTGALFADDVNRLQAELDQKLKQRDQLNEEIAQLTEQHSREQSAVRTREMKPQKRSLAGDRSAARKAKTY